MLHRMIVVGCMAVLVFAAPTSAQVKCGTTYCGTGTKCDSTLQQCIPLCGKIYCETGSKCDTASQQCIPVCTASQYYSAKFKKCTPTLSCKVDETFDVKKEACVSKCKSGEFFDAKTGKCILPCKPGEIYDAKIGKCAPPPKATSSTPAKSTAAAAPAATPSGRGTEPKVISIESRSSASTRAIVAPTSRSQAPLNTPYERIAAKYDALCPACSPKITESALNSKVVLFDAMRYQATSGTPAKYASVEGLMNTIYTKVDATPVGEGKAKEIAQGLLLGNAERMGLLENIKQKASFFDSIKTAASSMAGAKEMNTGEALAMVKDINEMNQKIAKFGKALGVGGSGGSENDIGGGQKPSSKTGCNTLSSSPYLGESCFNGGGANMPAGGQKTGDGLGGDVKGMVDPDSGKAPKGPNDGTASTFTGEGPGSSNAPCDAVDWNSLMAKAGSTDESPAGTSGAPAAPAAAAPAAASPAGSSATPASTKDKDASKPQDTATKTNEKVFQGDVQNANGSTAHGETRFTTYQNADGTLSIYQQQVVYLPDSNGKVDTNKPDIVQTWKVTAQPDKDTNEVKFSLGGYTGEVSFAKECKGGCLVGEDGLTKNPLLACGNGKNKGVAACTNAFLAGLCEDDGDAGCAMVQAVGLPAPEGGTLCSGKKKATPADVNVGGMWGSQVGGMGVTDPVNSKANPKAAGAVQGGQQPQQQNPNMRTK